MTNRGKTARRQPRQQGFTLIELLVVIAILSVLIGLVTVGVKVARKRSVMAQATVTIQQFEAAITDWEMARYFEIV